MKTTTGIAESPPLLRSYRADANKPQNWDGFRRDGDGQKAYAELSGTLIAAQRGLCCYCEITLIVPLGRQIEHVLSRSRFPHRALDPANMLAGCVGGSQPALAAVDHHFVPPAQRNLSCGQKKQSAQALDPRSLPVHRSIFVVTTDGRMVVDTEACAASGISRRDADCALRVLGLNAPRLEVARRKVMEQMSEMPEEPMEQREFVARKQLLPDSTGNLMPWFTTRRSHFGAIAEKILAEEPRDWIGRSSQPPQSPGPAA